MVLLRIVIIIFGILIIIKGLNPGMFIKDPEKIEKVKKWRILYIILGSTFIVIQLIIIALRSSY